MTARIPDALRTYIEEQILPRYDGFDAAHRRDHAQTVIYQSLAIAAGRDVREDMVYVAAAYHDTGLAEDRKTHHLVSGRIVRTDSRLREWFTEQEIEVMACAVEDHRASSDHAPRSIYGRIVAEADRFIDPDTIIRRTVQYGLDHYPELDREGHWQRTADHLHQKYAEGGYLRLWFPDSPNAARLEALRAVIRDEPLLRRKFDTFFDRLTDSKILLEWPIEKLWERFPIVLEPYRPCWHTWYEEEAARLRAVLPDGVKIHHIGSTAIPGICAKPIIDLLVELPRAETGICADTLARSETCLRSDACTHDGARASTFTHASISARNDALTRSGTLPCDSALALGNTIAHSDTRDHDSTHASTFTHADTPVRDDALPRGNAPAYDDTLTHSDTHACNGAHASTLACNDAFVRCKPLIERCGYLCMSECAGRMSFNKGYTPQGYAERVFHLHLRLPGDTDECLFRDYLCRHPAVALAYGHLKQTLAARYRHDRDAYTSAKTDFITLYTQKAREEHTA